MAPKPESSEPESEPYLVEASSTDTPAKQKNGKKASPYDQEFQAWYEGYPRKVGRGQALKAYRAARKKASLETLIAGRDRYAAGVRGKDRTFVKHPATWLNGECWADEPDDEAYREVCLNVARLRFVHGQRDYPWPADQHGPEPPFETLIGYLEPSDRDSVMAQKAAGLLR